MTTAERPVSDDVAGSDAGPISDAPKATAAFDSVVGQFVVAQFPKVPAARWPA